MPAQIDTRVQECIEQCQKCQQFCLDTIDHCLKAGGKHADADHIRMMMACVEICATCVRFMQLGSALSPKVCGICAEVCDACSKECARLQDMSCADTCQKCAAVCRALAA